MEGEELAQSTPRADSWSHFEVETDQPGEWPMPFVSETVRRVVVE